MFAYQIYVVEVYTILSQSNSVVPQPLHRMHDPSVFFFLHNINFSLNISTDRPRLSGFNRVTAVLKSLKNETQCKKLER